MEGLVFTPRRTDFLKDGSIFAQSPASTSGLSNAHLSGSHTGLRPGMEQKAVSNPQVVQAAAPLPHAATADSFAHAIWAPQPTRSSSTAAFGQTDMAAQIRAKFENLVRASPLPKVVEQLISPGNMFQQPQQPRWSAGLRGDRLGPPAWQANHLQANNVSSTGVSTAIQHADEPAGEAGPACQLSSQACLGGSWQAQLQPQSDNDIQPQSDIDSSRLVEDRGASSDAGPSMSHAHTAAHSAKPDHTMDTAAPLLNAAAPAIQQPPQLQHLEHTPEMLDTDKTQAAASATSHDTHPDYQTSHPFDSSGKGQQQQQQQSVSGVIDHTGIDAADATEGGMQIEQEAAGAAKGATLSQESSSMMSLSPSLKLDIPGLDDMLDSHMLSEHEDQAMSQPLGQPSLHQQQHTADQQHQPQQSVEEHRYQQKGDSLFMQDMPALVAEAQAASMLSAGPSSPPAHQSSPMSMPSASLPPCEQQPAEEAVSCSPITAVFQHHTSPQQHAKHSLDQSGTQNVQAAGTLLLSAAAAAAANTSGHDVPTASQGPQSPNTGCASELAVDDHSPAGPGPAESLLSQEHQVRSSDASEALQPLHDSLQSKPGTTLPGETRPSATGGAKSAETAAPDSAVVTDSKPGANGSSDAMPEASIHATESCDTGSAAQGTVKQQAHGAVPAPSETADAAAVEQLLDALTVPTQQDEAVDVSQQVAEPVQGVAANQEGPHTSKHTSVTAPKMAVQPKRRQPSSSTATGPASKRRCVVTRSSGGGQVQPLLTAPTDVTFQDKKGLYETSRSGRVRYPPLAFWMRETKVHDKLGGAIAIERPGSSSTPPAHPKPPQPPAPALTRTQSRSAPTQSQVKAQTQSLTQPQAKSQAKPQAASASSVEDPQAEVQSGTQAEVSRSDGSDDKPPLGQARHQLPVQHSRRHRASNAQPAVTVPPQDPPSPPFPYPILAGKSPKARVPTAAASSEQQTGQMANQCIQAQPQKQMSERKACIAKADGNKSDGVAAEAVGIATSKLAAARPSVGGSTAQLKRCGTCKTCMRPQSKQGCLVNKALREQALAVPTASATAAVPAEQGRAAKGSKPEKASQAAPNSKAKSDPSGAADKAVQQRKAETVSKSGTASRSAADTQLHKAGVSSKPARQPKARKAAGADKTGNVSSDPQASIRSALTQAVHLASDMEQPDADQQQQEAAQVLESLKNSPTAPSCSRSAASHPSPALLGPSATALGLSEGALQAGHDQAMQSQQTAAASPKSPPAKQERRGRPRKKPVPDAEEDKKPSGPKRGRGRPRKTPLAEPVEDPLAEGSELPPEGSCQQEQVLADATASSVPSGSALQQPREASRVVALQPLTSKAPSIKVKVQKVGTKGRQGNGSQAADAASTLEATGRPSISVRSPAAAGWTEDQKAALQKAYLTVKPSQRNFWQHVAKLVPGRTALECCNCKFDELPTPVEKVKQTARSAAAKDSSPIRPPALKVAGGRIKKPSAAATKQWARQVRWQQRAQEQSDDDSPQPPAQTTSLHRQPSNLGSSQRASATSTLLAAIHKQDKADKYIDRILRKQGGRLHKLKAVPVASASLQASKASQRGSQHATNGVMAELQALGRQQPENEDMYDSEQDHYFSEDDA